VSLGLVVGLVDTFERRYKIFGVEGARVGAFSAWP